LFFIVQQTNEQSEARDNFKERLSPHFLSGQNLNISSICNTDVLE